MNTWFVSDTHFGHANILKFKRHDGSPVRDFASVEEMDELLVARWNDLVRSGDRVWHLGDVFFHGGEKHLSRLNGTIRLILGNHDNPRSSHFAGFYSVSMGQSFSHLGFVATHYPLHDSDFGLAQGLVNVHGHIHEKPAPSARHINISVEQTGYAPIHIDELTAIVDKARAF